MPEDLETFYNCETWEGQRFCLTNRKKVVYLTTVVNKGVQS